jgi:hypothetical protein
LKDVLSGKEMGYGGKEGIMGKVPGRKTLI